MERSFNPKTGQPVDQHYATDWALKGSGVPHPSSDDQVQGDSTDTRRKAIDDFRNSHQNKKAKEAQGSTIPNTPVDPQDWDHIKRPQANTEQSNRRNAHMYGSYSKEEIKDLFKSDNGSGNAIKPPEHEADVLRKLGYGQNAIDAIKIERNFDKRTGKPLDYSISSFKWQEHSRSQQERLEPSDPGYNPTLDPSTPQFRMTDAFKKYLDDYQKKYGRPPTIGCRPPMASGNTRILQHRSPMMMEM